MPYVKIDNGTVVQKQPNKQKGFVEAPDYVVCGMIKDGDDFVLPPKSDADKWDNIRAKRDVLIAATDWAVLPDSPHNTQALLDYRQALRDLPQAYATPDDVVWPKNPLEGK